MRMGSVLMAALLLLAACSSPEVKLSDLLRNEPESWEVLDVGELNARIPEAVGAGDSCAYSPFRLMLHLVGGFDGSSMVAEITSNGGECPDEMTIVWIRDGFLDDSVRGDWHEFKFTKLDDNTWRVTEARVAYRCWRLGNSMKYRAGLCP